MMKGLCLVLSILGLAGVGYLVYDHATQKKNTPSATIPATFQTEDEAFATDLMGRAVTLPAGQLWGFNSDQNVTAKPVSKKAVEDNVVIVVDVKATAKIDHNPPPGPNDKEKAKPAPPGTPKQVTLSGLMKMYYERVNGQWYLIQLDGVSLKVSAE